MIVTICLLYKTFFTLGVLNPLMPSVYVHVALSYIPKISITVFALHLVILAIGVQGHSISGYLFFGHNWLDCDCEVLEFHVVLEHLLIYQVLLTHLATAVLRI